MRGIAKLFVGDIVETGVHTHLHGVDVSMLLTRTTGCTAFLIRDVITHSLTLPHVYGNILWWEWLGCETSQDVKHYAYEHDDIEQSRN